MMWRQCLAMRPLVLLFSLSCLVLGAPQPRSWKESLGWLWTHAAGRSPATTQQLRDLLEPVQLGDDKGLDEELPGWQWRRHFEHQRQQAASLMGAVQLAAAGAAPRVEDPWAPQLPRALMQRGIEGLQQAPGMPATNFNSAPLTPLIPHDYATWMERLRELMEAWALNATSKLPRDSSQLYARAKLLADMTSITYCTHRDIRLWNCTRCGKEKVGDFQTQHTVYDKSWDLFAYVGFSEKLDAMLVAFRGTDSHSLYNWIENMRYWRTDLQLPYPDAKGALVHTGFFYSYNASSLAPNISAAVRELVRSGHGGKPLYVAGHSMGAAMAHMCALDLYFQPDLGLKDVRLYTYGSPRVGNKIFEEFLMDHVTESVRVTRGRDIVPSVPIQSMGFHHVWNEVWQTDTVAWVPQSIPYLPCIGPTLDDDPGEVPYCHNSMCYLGLCTSISDHLEYMQAPMYHHPAPHTDC